MPTGIVFLQTRLVSKLNSTKSQKISFLLSKRQGNHKPYFGLLTVQSIAIEFHMLGECIEPFFNKVQLFVKMVNVCTVNRGVSNGIVQRYQGRLHALFVDGHLSNV
jgi:prepilin-type processing-associated H-X9-DG protein